MKTRVLLVMLLIVVVAAAAVSVVYAGSTTLSGTLTPGGATEPVVAQISTPNCTGGTAAFSVLYAVYPFTVDATGAYTFTEPGTESALYLYSGSFDPNSPATNCIAATNSNPLNLVVNLTAGTQYYVVVIEDTFAQDGMSYSINISGPGNIILPAGACPYPLPAGSVVYSIPAGAPAFFSPDLASQTTFAIPAGTWYISEFSGDFAKVWIACEASPVWVPANAVAR